MVRSDFDLAGVRPADDLDLLSAREACRRQSPDEILVCGRRRSADGYPMEEMERVFATRPIVAEMSIGGGAAGRAFVESAALDRGAVSTRVMVGIRLPF
jgi:hypothetical protein